MYPEELVATRVSQCAHNIVPITVSQQRRGFLTVGRPLANNTLYGMYHHTSQPAISLLLQPTRAKPNLSADANSKQPQYLNCRRHGM
jgi:hypothetical protein